MESSLKFGLMAAALAAATLGAATGANARPSVDISVSVPADKVFVQMPAQAAYPVQSVHGGPRAASCGARRWNPHQRYMPGQLVRRHGELWIATSLSARMWNENSPPEWTPNLWAPAVCAG